MFNLIYFLTTGGFFSFNATIMNQDWNNFSIEHWLKKNPGISNNEARLVIT